MKLKQLWNRWCVSKLRGAMEDCTAVEITLCYLEALQDKHQGDAVKLAHHLIDSSKELAGE